ncbi:Gag-Pol poly, partial [Schistosoma japonicum]
FCNLCFRANHIVRICRLMGSCTVERCGRRHHTFLHAKQKEQSNGVNDVYVNTRPCRGIEREHEQGATPNVVALTVVPVLLKHNEGTVQTCAFLDSGPNASLISHNLVDKLEFEGEPKT